MGGDFRHIKRLVNGDSHLSTMEIVSDLNASFPKTCNNTNSSYLFEGTGLSIRSQAGKIMTRYPTSAAMGYLVYKIREVDF